MNKKNVVLAIVTLIVFFGIYSFRLADSFYVDTDFARDTNKFLEASRGELSLIGPPLSVGTFAGPYYHYFFVPALILSHLNETSILYVNAAFFALSIAATYLLIGRRAWLLGIGAFWIISARHPGNAFTYLPLLALWIIIILIKKRWGSLNALSLGLLTGLILNFHPISILAIFPVLITQFIKFKKVIFVFIFGALVTFGPLAVFELRNNFVMTRNVFTNKSYQQFENQLPTVYHTQAKSSFFENYIFLSDKSRLLLGFPIEILWIIALFALSKRWWIGPISFLSTTFMMKNLFEPHYLLPSLALSMVVPLLTNKNKFLMLILAIFILVSFPHTIYKPSVRPLSQFRMIAEELSSLPILADGFNIVEIIEPYHYVPSGDMFRYHFLRLNKNLYPVTDYSSPKTLVIFSEDDSLEIERLSFWEVDQFDNQRAQKISLSDSDWADVYLLPKK